MSEPDMRDARELHLQLLAVPTMPHKGPSRERKTILLAALKTAYQRGGEGAAATGWSLVENAEIEELKRLLKVAEYDRGFLQKRLDALREVKDKLIHLIEHPTLSERLDALKPGDNVMSAIMGNSPKRLQARGND